MNHTITTFFDLDAWKAGHKLTLHIYQVTNTFPKSELFGITSQLRRALCSVTANIAEGFARFHFKDKIRFYYQARGSVAEVQNFLRLALDLHYMTVQEYDTLLEQSYTTTRLLNGMIRSIEKQQKATIASPRNY